MSSLINPEAATPVTVQSFEQSNRNPAVNNWGEAGGQIAAPPESATRVTPAGAAADPNAGLKDYNTGDTAQ